MQSATFVGEVQGGVIRTGQTLAEFEGKKVSVTLTALDPPARTDGTNAPRSLPATLPRASEEAEILDDVGRIVMPPRTVTSVHLSMVDVGRLPMRVYSSDGED